MKNYMFVFTLIFVISLFAQVSEPKEGHYGCTYLEEPNYIVNKESVFFENCSIHRKVDVKSDELKVIVGGLAFDNKNMFYNGIKLNVTPNNPKAISANSYNDKTSVYWINKGLLYRNKVEMSKIDTLTFTVLGGGYFKDATHVYFKAKVVEGANTDSFIYNHPFGYDKSSVYSNENKMKFNGNLQSVNGYYFKDDTTVYQYNYDFLFDLEPKYDVSIDNATSIPKTKYGIINDTLYYLKTPTLFHHINMNSIRVFSDDLISFNNKVIYKGVSTDELDSNSIQVVKNNDYLCLVKDDNGSYELSVTNSNLPIVRLTPFDQKNESGPKPHTTIRPLRIVKDKLYRGDYSFAEKSLLTQGGMTNFDTIELVSILKGYRMGCSRDTQSSSNYYILKNSQGYWELLLSNEDTLTFIGKSYKF